MLSFAAWGGAEPAEPVHVTEGITPPKVTEKGRPAFPEAARGKLAGEAKVGCQIVVREDGTVDKENIKVLKQPDPDFYGSTKAALDAVRQWKFKPAMKDGKAISVYNTVAISFIQE